MNSSCGICRFRQATLTPQKQGMLKRPHNSREEHFAEALQSELDARNSAVGFSKHAMKRIESRNIEILDSDMLQRLNDGIEIAAEKGSNETLVLVDRTAFVVSVKNRTVITTMSQEDLKGNIFTNIDSTVIM